MNKVQKNVAILFAILFGVVVAVVLGSLYAQKYAYPKYTAELAELSFSGDEALILVDHPALVPASTVVKASGEVVLESDNIIAEYNYQDDLYLLADDYDNTAWHNEYSRTVYRVVGHDLQEVVLPEDYFSHSIQLSTSANDDYTLLRGEDIRELYLQKEENNWNLIDTQTIPEEYVYGDNQRDLYQTVVRWSESDNAILYIEIGEPENTSALAYEYNVETNEWRQIERTAYEVEYNRSLLGFATFPQKVCASKWRGFEYVVMNGDYRYSQCSGTYYDKWETEVTTPIIGKQKVQLQQVDGKSETVLSWFSFLANRMGSAQLLDADANHVLVSVDGKAGVYERATGMYAPLVTVDGALPRWPFHVQVLSTP